jgi:amidase
MAVSVPTPSQLREIASEVGLDLTDTDVTSFIELMRPSVAAYNGSCRIVQSCSRAV